MVGSMNDVSVDAGVNAGVLVVCVPSEFVSKG